MGRLFVSLAVCCFFLGCDMKVFKEKANINQDIEDCDNMSNYYEHGDHYIKRDLVTDEGVIDRKEMFDRYKNRNSNCFPTKTFGRLKR